MTDNSRVFDQITSLRGFAVIGVLIIHATAPVLEYGIIANNQLVLSIICLNQWARFSVPLFFFLSGYIYATIYQEKDIHYFVFFKRRLQSILVPYLFWSCFYCIMRFATGDFIDQQISVGDVFLLFLTGQAWGHLYFIPAIFQFYILLPFLLSVAKSKCRFICLLAATVLLSGIFYVFRLQFILSESGGVVPVWGKTYWFYCWLPYIFLGIYAGLGDPLKNIKFPKLYNTIAFCCLLLVVSEYAGAFFYGDYYGLSISSATVGQIPTFLRPSALIYSLVSIISLVLLSRTNFPLMSFWQSIGKYSFGIYLIHPFVNKLVVKIAKILGTSPVDTVWSVVLLLTVGSLVSYFIVRIVSLSPFSKLIFGSTR